MTNVQLPVPADELLSSKELIPGITFDTVRRSYRTYKGEITSYETRVLNGMPYEGLAELEVMAVLLSRATEFEGIVSEDWLQEYASEIAEGLELPFSYTDAITGKVNTYTPAALWESSGSCEWETSAQYGYDYGWNV